MPSSVRWSAKLWYDGAIPLNCHDGVRHHPVCDGARRECFHEAISGTHVVYGRRDLAGRQKIRILVHQILHVLRELYRQRDESADETQDERRHSEASLVGGGNEYDAGDIGERFEEHSLLKLLPQRGIGLDLGEGFPARRVPETGPTVGDHQAREHTPLAVADQNDGL